MYFQFVDSRQVSAVSGIVPDIIYLLQQCTIIVIAILAAYWFLDPIFIERYLSGDLSRPQIFELTTHIGKSDWILSILGLVLIVMSLIKYKTLYSYKFLRWHNWFLKAYFAFTAIAFSGLIAILLKNIIGRGRPITLDGSSTWLSMPFSDSYTFASFPSGHSTTMGAIAAIVILLFPKFRTIVILIALWVGASRVALGSHFPSDVVAGLALGIMFTWIYARMFARKRLLFMFTSNGSLELKKLSRRSTKE